MGSSRTGDEIGRARVMRMEKSTVAGEGLCREVERRTMDDQARMGRATCLDTNALLYSRVQPLDRW